MLGGWYKILVSRLVTRFWPLVIAGWVLVAIGLRIVAPPWSNIAADGDLAFLPAEVPSAVGQQTLQGAFPSMRSRSQMVLVFATSETDLGLGDLALAFDIARRLHWIAARNAIAAMESENQANGRQVLSEVALDNLREAIEIEEILGRYLQVNGGPQHSFLRLPDAYALRGELLKELPDSSSEQQSLLDLDTAQLMIEQRTPTLRAELPTWSRKITDVWCWRHPIVGHKLGSEQARARLINLQLSSDFTATSNIETITGIERLIEELRPKYASLTSDNLQIEVSGSAAVGADMLRAASSGVRKTEIVTIVLVLLILSAVYRAPFLVAIPLTSIALSLLVATSVIALLARDPNDANSAGLGVFTTTRIFIVVLLFGAGTDFCLFFLARNREILTTQLVRTRRQRYRIIARSWRSVHDGIVASAMTTIVGLALMWFSRFQKFQFSGPIIAISLAITLVVCLSFTPALLSGLGSVAFWPQLTRARDDEPMGASKRKPGGYWGWLSSLVVAKPLNSLLITLNLLAVPAAYGFACLGLVTYDLTEELSESSASRRGAKLISQYFPTQDGSPITVLLTREQAFDSEDSLKQACSELSSSLYIEGVDAVRSLTDPLGDYPPGKRMGLFDRDAWRRRLLNRITQERFVSSVDDLSRRVARFDVVLSDNPFSLEAGATLLRLNRLLQDKVSEPSSPWNGASVATAGTTVGVTDLRIVTQADQSRIQILVTLGVWLVLVFMLRQWVLSTYLIFTVLLSYFATLGITFATFSMVYGAGYSGLDWKVPLFLFVILVAVGQDYNVYLITRIFEERRQFGLRRGVGRALEFTGGIITSCGFVMAGTFIAMTSPAVLLWLSDYLPVGWIDAKAPVLRGITELGFALACGVLLDTLIVRSVLVPAFVVLWQSENETLSEPARE